MQFAVNAVTDFEFVLERFEMDVRSAQLDGVFQNLVDEADDGRLVRVLCPHCKKPDTSATAQAFKAKLGIDAGVTLFHTTGCRECRNTGFFGRQAIFEWMDTDEEIRQLILKNASTDQFRKAARKGGMRTLAEDGWRLVAQGITTVEEVLSVTTAKEVESATKSETPDSAASIAVAR